MFARILILLTLTAALFTLPAKAQRVDSLLDKAITDPGETFGGYTPSSTPENYDLPDYGDYRHFYEQAVTFDYNFLRMRPRGLPQRYTHLTYDGLELTDPYYNTPLWSAATGIHAVTNYQSIDSRSFFPYQSYSNEGNIYDHTGRVGYSFSNRTYTNAVTASYGTGPLGNSAHSWYLFVSGAYRGGRSLTTDGVWANGWTGSLAVIKELRHHKISLGVFYSPMERAYANASTEEAFALTGNNLYNPSWGYQGGTVKKDERSARIRSTQVPVGYFNYQYIGRRVQIYVNVSGGYGRLSSSALNWQDAANPYPDYYRNMPSYQTDPVVRERLTQLWATDPSVSQIAFAELYARNRATSSSAHYIMENRVRDLAISRVSLTLNHNFKPRTFLAYGIVGSMASERNYKTVRDLMGASYWLDVDHFLESDDDFRELTQVNMADPNRHVEEGDVFGYNYRLQYLKGEAWISVRQQLLPRFYLDFGGSVGLNSVSRYGYWEKQNFAGDESLGQSPALTRVESHGLVTLEYTWGSKWSIHGQGVFSSKVPTARDAFLNPQYRNALVADPVNEKLYAGQIDATYKSSKLRASVNLYYAQMRDVTRLHHLYDDIEGAYVDMVMRRVATEHMGFEASVEVLLTRDLWIKGMFNLPIARYIGNPEATTYRQTTGEELRQQTVYFDNLRVASVPSFLASAALSYEPRGWTVTLTANGFGNSYVTPSPTRYTEAATRKAASATMTTQEIMPAGVTLNLFGGKTFYLSGFKRINLYAGINNLLNNRNIAVSGYQSYRLARDTQGRYSPHANRYYYGLGINGFVSASFTF